MQLPNFTASCNARADPSHAEPSRTDPSLPNPPHANLSHVDSSRADPPCPRVTTSRDELSRKAVACQTIVAEPSCTSRCLPSCCLPSRRLPSRRHRAVHDQRDGRSVQSRSQAVITCLMATCWRPFIALDACAMAGQASRTVTVVCARKPTVPPRGRVVLALSAALQLSIHPQHERGNLPQSRKSASNLRLRGARLAHKLSECVLPCLRATCAPYPITLKLRLHAVMQAATRIRTMPLVSSMSSSMSSSLDSGLTVDGWPPNWAPTPAQQPSSGLVRASVTALTVALTGPSSKALTGCGL